MTQVSVAQTRRAARFVGAGVLLCLGVTAWMIPNRLGVYLPARYVMEQDLPVIWVLALVVTGFIALLAKAPAYSASMSGGFSVGLSRAVFAGLVLGVVPLAWAGSHLAFAAYPLTADEWWATAEGANYWQGLPYAPMAAEWRGFAAAMTPSYVVTSVGETLWGSMYLPVNGLLQTLLPWGVTSALLTGASLGLVWLAAQRIEPGRPLLAAVALLLLLGSSQLVVTGMTAYAMSAHLAFNLLWLVLVLCPRARAQALAALVAFAAIGLHQPVFFPLFAAPFVLGFWLRRDWGRACWQSGAIAMSLLFWGNWLALGMGWLDGTLPVGEAAGWTQGPLGIAQSMLGRVRVSDAGVMAMNLLRLVTWTHPLLLILALAGFAAAWRAGGTMRSLVAGVVLTLGVVALLSPQQGHGWGYRYLHGLLGNLALIGAFGFLRIFDAVPPAEGRRFWTGFLGVTALAVLVLLPLRMWQAHRFVAPYVAANAAIAATDADFVVVTDDSHAFTVDLVRNDPFLRNRPLRFAARMLTPAQLDLICARGSVLRFDAVSAENFGIPPVKASPLLLRWPEGCGTNRVGG